MHSPGINEEGELRGEPANPGSPGKKMAVKMEGVYVCVCDCMVYTHVSSVLLLSDDNVQQSFLMIAL